MTLLADAAADGWTLVVSAAINAVLTLATGYFAMRANLAKIAAEAEPAKLRGDVSRLTDMLAESKDRLEQTEAYADECRQDRHQLREEVRQLREEVRATKAAMDAAANRERGRHPDDPRIPAATGPATNDTSDPLPNQKG